VLRKPNAVFSDKYQTMKNRQFVQSNSIKLTCISAFLIFASLFLINCKPEQKQPEIVEKQPAVVNSNASNTQTSSALPTAIPASYTKNCAECHGDKGQGIKASPELTGLTTREEDRRSDEDLLEILNNPKSFGLSSKMKSYKDKLSEEEKQAIILWMKSLK
jgi:mono/diheme cytochrome c family protein